MIIAPSPAIEPEEAYADEFATDYDQFPAPTPEELAAAQMAKADPVTADGERGVITLTASVAAQDGQIGQVVYGSCKAGVNGLVLPMARDLMDRSVPIFFCTGSLADEVHSVFPGVPVVPKPFVAESLLGAIAQVVGFPSSAARG